MDTEKLIFEKSKSTNPFQNKLSKGDYSAYRNYFLSSDSKYRDYEYLVLCEIISDLKEHSSNVMGINSLSSGLKISQYQNNFYEFRVESKDFLEDKLIRINSLNKEELITAFVVYEIYRRYF